MLFVLLRLICILIIICLEKSSGICLFIGFGDCTREGRAVFLSYIVICNDTDLKAGFPFTNLAMLWMNPGPCSC